MSKKSQWKVVAILAAVLLLLGFCVSRLPVSSESSEESQKESTEDYKERRKEEIIEVLDRIDGSHPQIVEWTKNQLNDPSSFEHLETFWYDQDSIVIFNMSYTAKNGFGGRIRGEVKAKADGKGKVIEILESN